MPDGASTTNLLLTIAEPTRLRILNCLAAAPLFVSDLQEVLELPQPTVSRHLKVLRSADIELLLAATSFRGRDYVAAVEEAVPGLDAPALREVV